MILSDINMYTIIVTAIGLRKGELTMTGVFLEK